MRTMFLFSTICAAVYKTFDVDSHFRLKETIASTNPGSLESHMARKGGDMDTIQNRHN